MFHLEINSNLVCVFEEGTPGDGTTLSQSSTDKEHCAQLCLEATTNDPTITGAIYVMSPNPRCRCAKSMTFIFTPPSKEFLACLFTSMFLYLYMLILSSDRCI